MKKINKEKLLVVDLNSGRYAIENIGHELFNLDKNPIDNKFYGYCPPWDGVEISKFGAKKSDEYIDGVTVIYVSKMEGSNDREIIGFCLNARVFRLGQSGEELNRFIKKDNEVKSASFSIVSDNLRDLRKLQSKFEIKIKDYNLYMFRKQRFYGGKYPKLDDRIELYLKTYLENKTLLDNDGTEEQEAIQASSSASESEIEHALTRNLQIVDGNHGKMIRKNSRVSKAAIIAANYICMTNLNHTSFLTKHQVFYMEGHHLIPCTVQNSEFFWNKFQRNIDCFENIVSLCPNCHRAIHYGDWDCKSKLIKVLFEKQKGKLYRVGIMITLEELLDLYRS